MQAIMISIQPQWFKKILSGEKTIEIRKTMPKCELPCKVYIYCTKAKPTLQYFYNWGNYKPISECSTWAAGSTINAGEYGNGKIVAEFTLKTIDEYEFELWDDNTYESIGKVYYDIETGEREVDVFESDEDIEKTELAKDSNLTRPQLRQYLGTGFRTCFAWHIDDLVVYDKPKELSEFYSLKKCDSCKKGGYESAACRYDEDCKIPIQITRPPQSWCYVEEI